MAHTDLAHAAALLGAAACVVTLLARTRLSVLAGFALLTLAEVGLGVALVPSHDLSRLVSPPTHAVAVLFGLAVVAACAAAFVRYPGAALVALLIAAPFRISVTLGSTHAMLLLPLYAVLAAATLAFLWETLRGTTVRVIPLPLALPTACLLGFYGLSLLWGLDVHAGSVELAAFLFPFAALVAVVARMRLPAWAPRVLAMTLVGEALVFALFGLWEEVAKRVFFSPFLEVSNAYTTYFRTNSLFYDPNIYGRHLVLAIVTLVVLMWRRAVPFWLAAGLSVVLWIGLFYSYSQSSLASLFLAVLAVTFVAGDGRTRRILAIGALVCVVAGGLLVVATGRGHSLRRLTSDRSHLISVTLDTFKHHPLVGVGVGSQPAASQTAGTGSARAVKANASHTTPLTVLAEIGIVGFAAYLAWLAGAARNLRAAWRRDQTVGLALSAAFFVLVTHSLFYSGFFEDPITWGSLAVAAALSGDIVPVPWRDLPAWLMRFSKRKRVLIPLGILGLLLLAALGAALSLRLQGRSFGRVLTSLTSATVITRTVKSTEPVVKGTGPPETCWDTFGGDPARTLARPDTNLGPPGKSIWAHGLHDLMEYPPSYCNGFLYVNLEQGRTLAINAANGHIVWSRKAAGFTASTPAIAGQRLIVSSHGGTVTAFERATGHTLWQLRTGAPVESSPVVVANTVYVGASDGKLYALNVVTGAPRWVYDTGGRISSSPSVFRGRVCITTYSGLVLCLYAGNGHRIWADAVRRDFLQYDSFYASASSDGDRVFTVSRSGQVLALSAASGHRVWTYRLGTTAYGTPAVANGRVFVGDFAGDLNAFRSTTGHLLWRVHVSGRILAPPLVVGNLVFFSTLTGGTYAARTTDGKIVWHIAIGKYSPGIATNRHYYFSLNGLLVAYKGTK
jgi:outer membrane protein assembly factor BamB/O-antigen ligase